MCGRYYVDEGVWQDIRRIISKVEVAYSMEAAPELGLMMERGAERKARTTVAGDIYPSQSAPVLFGVEGRMAGGSMRWGFLPRQGKGLLINARAETILEKKTFQESIQSRRCALPARHFYEWNENKEKAVCYQPGKATLYLAGCYSLFEGEKRFVVITTRANETLSKVHSRMPLLLKESELGDWLFDDAAARAMLERSPALAEYRMEYEQLRLFE